VQVTTPTGHVVVEFCDPVDNGHGSTPYWAGAAVNEFTLMLTNQ
jgi:hypothetical protein